MSIFNFHYAHAARRVAMNYGLNKVIGDDETGSRDVGRAYRIEGWEFLLAGGGPVQQSRLLVHGRTTRTARSRIRRSSLAAGAASSADR